MTSQNHPESSSLRFVIVSPGEGEQLMYSSDDVFSAEGKALTGLANLKNDLRVSGLSSDEFKIVSCTLTEGRLITEAGTELTLFEDDFDQDEALLSEFCRP